MISANVASSQGSHLRTPDHYGHHNPSHSHNHNHNHSHNHGNLFRSHSGLNLSHQEGDRDSVNEHHINMNDHDDQEDHHHNHQHHTDHNYHNYDCQVKCNAEYAAVDWKTILYLSCIAFIVITSIVLIILAALGKFSGR